MTNNCENSNGNQFVTILNFINRRKKIKTVVGQCFFLLFRKGTRIISSAVETRSHVQKERETFKTLNLPTISKKN